MSAHAYVYVRMYSIDHPSTICKHTYVCMYVQYKSDIHTNTYIWMYTRLWCILSVDPHGDTVSVCVELTLV